MIKTSFFNHLNSSLLAIASTAIACFLFFAVDSFAFDDFDVNKNPSKTGLKNSLDGGLKKETVAKSEPHFDLPKKDAKEQCEEVERVVRECKDKIRLSENEASIPVNIGGVNATQTNGGILKKCGNVYLISSWALPDTCTAMVIINQRGQYVGINKRCSKWKDIEYFYMSQNGYIGMIYDEKEKHKKGLTILKTRDCHIISSFNN